MTESQDESAFKDVVIGLLLVGAAVTRNGDSERIRKAILPELLESYFPEKAMKALQNSDRRQMAEFLAQCGVQLQKGETVVDALIRTHLSTARLRLEQRLKHIEDTDQAECERFSKKRTNGGEPDE